RLAAAGYLGGARVIGFQRDTCGTGQLGDSFRLTLDYSVPNAGPATLIAKFASQDPTSREFGRSSGYYRSEIQFYQQLAPRLPVEVPVAVHAALSQDGADFVLLMEDLAPAKQVDQLVGCSADDSARVMEQAAALHAASWQDGNLAAVDWLKGTVGLFNQVTDNLAGVIGNLPTLCGDLVDAADLAEAAKIVPYTAQWKQVIAEPQCLWHSDLRADNVLFDAAHGRRPVVVLDWQGLGFGRGSMDIALWLGTSMALEERRRHERDLVAHYHQMLVRGGVQGYSAEQCWQDYRLHALHGLIVGVFGVGAVKRTPRGDRMWKTWIERTAAQVRDLGSIGVLAQAGA
ncbi:MAG TPA: phosphotransferase, partial [Macromonas sp.]|nr:phosphotransferase [Macromonas sp.]